MAYSSVSDVENSAGHAEAGRREGRREPVSLDALLRDIYEETLILASEKSLRVDLVENAPAVVTGDETRLRRLFRALTSNAVRYSDPGGEIWIRSRTEDGSVRVEVEDTGIGIPASSVGKIFERFYRVDEARSRDSGGSGLGLCLARWIAESHQGRIEVSSEPGKGSLFRVTLPVAVGPR